ncbi:MAG: hypothetical protein ACRDWD_07135, partial [Acidimicrobiia bacterium]
MTKPTTATPSRFRLHDLPRAVYQFSHRYDTAILVLLDAGVITGAWVLAYLAGLEADIPSGAVDGIALFVASAVVTQLVVNRFAGLYGPVWRFASVQEAVRVVVAVGVGSAIAAMELVALSRVTDAPSPVLSAPPIAALLMLLGCGGIRFQARLFALERRRIRSGPDDG